MVEGKTFDLYNTAVSRHVYIKLGGKYSEE